MTSATSKPQSYDEQILQAQFNSFEEGLSWKSSLGSASSMKPSMAREIQTSLDGLVSLCSNDLFFTIAGSDVTPLSDILINMKASVEKQEKPNADALLLLDQRLQSVKQKIFPKSASQPTKQREPEDQHATNRLVQAIMQPRLANMRSVLENEAKARNSTQTTITPFNASTRPLAQRVQSLMQARIHGRSATAQMEAKERASTAQPTGMPINDSNFVDIAYTSPLVASQYLMMLQNPAHDKWAIIETIRHPQQFSDLAKQLPIVLKKLIDIREKAIGLSTPADQLEALNYMSTKCRGLMEKTIADFTPFEHYTAEEMVHESTLLAEYFLPSIQEPLKSTLAASLKELDRPTKVATIQSLFDTFFKRWAILYSCAQKFDSKAGINVMDKGMKNLFKKIDEVSSKTVEMPAQLADSSPKT